MKKLNYCIENVSIYGKIHPLFVIRITGSINKDLIKIYENNRLLQYDVLDSDGFIYIKCKLKRRNSNVSLKLLNDKSDVISEYNFKNNIFNINKNLFKKYCNSISRTNSYISNFKIIEVKKYYSGTQKKIKIFLFSPLKDFLLISKMDDKLCDFTVTKLLDNLYCLNSFISEDSKNFSIYVKENNKETKLFSIDCSISNKKENIFLPSPFICINELKLTGIVNHKIKVIGTSTLKQPKFNILVDDVCIDKFDFNIDDNGLFYINANLPKKFDCIKFLLVVNGEEMLIFKIYNSIFKRLSSIAISLKEKINNKKNIYYYNENIGIKCCSLTGIFHPLVNVQGTSNISTPDFKFVSNKGIVNYESRLLSDSNSFYLDAKLPRGVKYITFYVNDIAIIKLKNSFLRRLKNKFRCFYSTIKNKIKNFNHLFIKAIKLLWREHHFLVPPKLWGKYFNALKYKLKSNNPIFYNPNDIYEYNQWLNENVEIDTIMKFKYNPLISILIPVYNVDSIYLKECLDSILCQSYQNFEICLVDDCSTKQETLKTLDFYETLDSRIKVLHRKQNGHISMATNDALKMAKGEFIALMDNDDTISKNALYENVRVLNSDMKLDFIYSDEDKLNQNGVYCYPHFKPDYSPDTLMSLNYICHFSVIRKSIVEKVGGFEVGLEGAQDHDLFLKISEVTNKFYHIPKILYHWRMIPTSTSMNASNKSYAADKGMLSIEHALIRRGLKGIVRKDEQSGYYIVDYRFDVEPKVSIIIPTRDYAETTENCLKSLYKKTTYKNFEVILVNNNSVEKETFELFEKYKKLYKNFKVLDANIEFNYSKINNLAVESSDADYICLLNNDTEIISEDWLSNMVGFASLPHVGAVGAKLLYPDTTVQHGGVIYGLGGVASHAYIGSSRDDLGMYGRLRVPYNYGAVTAACLVIKKSKFIEVGGLEEDLKVAYNDVDLNLKLLKNGYYNVCLLNVELFHYESKSRGLDTTSEKYKRFLSESEYMYNKWQYELNHDKFYNNNFSSKGWFVLDKVKEGTKNEKK